MEDAASDSLQDKGIGSRVQSQELLDSSSASSLSVFADHTDVQGSTFRANDSGRKLDSSSPRASMDEALKSEAAFIQYVMSIPTKQESPACEHHRSADSMHRSPAGGATTTKVGLDHLDNLCKLMEQLSELRDTNSKLQKRVQYLEDLKTLHDMHKEICEGGEEYSSEDALVDKPQPQQMPYKLTKSATESHCVKEESSRSPSRYLSRRSRSGGQQQQTGRRGRSKSVGHEDLGEDPKSRRLFPKWSRVKEAFGWESERKGSIKVKEECGTVLGPRRRSDESRQMYRHAASPTWYQQSPSIHSSIGEIDVDFEEERWKKMSVSSEKYVCHLEAPHESLRRQKSTPSPGSDKLIYCRDSTDLKAKASTIERDSYRNNPDFSKFDKDECKRGKSPWGRVKTIIERHRDSIKRRSLRRDHSDCDVPSGKNHPDTPLDFTDYLNAKNVKQKGSKPPPIILEPEEGSGSHSPGSSPGQQRKSRWNRMTKAWKGKKEGERDHQSLSTPTSPNNNEDGNFTFDAIEENSPDSYSEGRELSRVGSDSHVHQLALSVSSSDLMVQLQRNLSEDFYRKIQEWERIRGTPHQTTPRKAPSKAPAKIKTDLSWLEKELQKIDKEKQRLAKERRKFEEREQRLEKLKESVLSSAAEGGSSKKREVLVKTSAGEFRFEGISDAFTKKLYEWETKRGVGPELSTLALLDSSSPVMMSRVMSRSESSVVEMGQGSHNSSNSLPSVKCVEEDRQASRANSEPDLNALAVMANGAGLAVAKTARLKKEEDITIPVPSKEEEEFDQGRKGSYIGLLEENVVLLDQLREKEDICRRLEKDLEILDEKMDEMHGRHVQETQRYREKLWEMHQQGASPRDVPGCRHYMMQLRKRIEYLESWTDKLRSERETVEVNFRHHSKEQETMTLDLLEKMRELQAAGTSKQDCGTKRDSQLDTCALERLQDLSALLTKQTQHLEKTLSHKTRQICQLKWELLNRDLTSVKKETEQHVHSSAALRKRSKYAQWRSRSSEESSAVACQPKPCDSNYIEIATKLYSNNSSDDDITATNLANTVQELNKELLKLASGTSCNSLSKYLEEVGKYSSVQSSTRSLEQSRSFKKLQTPSKEQHPKKITVRRSSADNLCSSSEIRPSKKDNTSSTYSDDSSDEYYSRVFYNNTPRDTTERLLMSHGEVRHALRKRKVSRLLSRKRSNTFHTNRDLQRPDQPQKCQSFREPREKGNDVKTPPYLRRKQQQQIQEEVKRKISEERILQQVISLGNLEVLRNYENNWLREVSSDSKIPALVGALEGDVVKGGGKSPARSSSEKTKKETAVERREHLQKKRSKKRLKSPDALVPANPISNSTSTDSFGSKKVDKTSNGSGLKSSFRKSANSDYSQKNSSEKENCRTEPESAHKKPNSPTNEVPTITIQLPKRKLRKTSRDAVTTEEHTVTINMPKKRSFSSEKDSSISDHSTVDTPKLPHSDQTPQQPSDTSSTHSVTTESSKENIKLMRLVSLEKFESPFSKLAQPRKRKAEDEEIDAPTEEMKDMLNVNSVAKSSTTANLERTNKDNDESNCIKSPSAPQLHWRKVCAKKVTKPGAPNVRNLIERYNQKVAESQVYKSPLSSNVSSPASIRKISSPVSGSATPDYIPRFCSTPNSPSNYSPLSSPMYFKTSNSSFSKSPPSSPRSEALRLAKERFISSQQCPPPATDLPHLADRVSCGSMDSMNLVMIRAGENCRESRMRSGNDPRAAGVDDGKQQQQPLKTSKSLSSSSIFKAVMSTDFKMPTNLLRLKRSKRKKDMAAVTELCRQSLLLTTDDVKNIPTAAAHKSCPSSPELKSKSAAVKSSWLHRNIFRHK